jgi:hypothetical protein
MKRCLIIGKFGVSDQPSVPVGCDETLVQLNLISANRRLDFGIGKAIEDLEVNKLFPSEIGLDLLVLAAHVYAADTRISRGTRSQDTWTREIRLVVPVSAPDRWNSAAPILVRMLNFLTGDYWTISFRARPKRFMRIVPNCHDQICKIPFDSIALFSGGLDSLIGAINLLEARKTPLFISHASEGATSDAQNTLYEALKKHYQKSVFERLRLWMVFPKGFVKDSGSENTTRARSFLFFSIGIFAATGLKGHIKMKVPENGLIALNVPLDPLRLGALSTRTTHPFYMARWNELLTKLEINCRVENPYWNKTKGEMVIQCRNQTLLKNLAASSLSCSSPTKGRWQGHGIQHCGYCLPCLIRRAALLSGFGKGEDKTIYTIPDLNDKTLDTFEAEGQQVRSLQFAIERLQREPSSAKLLIHKPGPLSDDPSRWDELADVYRRGLNEVAVILANVTTCPGG